MTKQQAMAQAIQDIINQPDPSPTMQPQAGGRLAWLANQIQMALGMDTAMQTFYLATDKEVALMASYRAMGLDPRDAPKFGWNMIGRPGVTNITTTHASATESGNVRTTGVASWVKGLAAGAILVAAGALGASMIKPTGGFSTTTTTTTNPGTPGTPGALGTPGTGTPAVPAGTHASDVIEEQQQPDGTWKEIPGMRVRVNPNGTI